MGLMLPDFAELEWDHVIRIRSSGAGLDLRRNIASAAHEIASVAGDIDDSKDLTILIQKHYLAELAEEVRKENPTLGKTALNFAANLIPGFGSVVTSAADVANLLEHKNSWVALVGKAK